MSTTLAQLTRKEGNDRYINTFYYAKPHFISLSALKKHGNKTTMYCLVLFKLLLTERKIVHYM